MFGLGGTEVLVIFVLALLLFGPRKLPEIGRTLGKTLGELRRATMDFRLSLEREVELDKLKQETLGPLRDVVSLGEKLVAPEPSVPQAERQRLPPPAAPAAPPAETPDPQDASRSDEA